jgi:hypothetical protein
LGFPLSIFLFLVAPAIVFLALSRWWVGRKHELLLVVGSLLAVNIASAVAVFSVLSDRGSFNEFRADAWPTLAFQATILWLVWLKYRGPALGAGKAARGFLSRLARYRTITRPADDLPPTTTSGNSQPPTVPGDPRPAPLVQPRQTTSPGDSSAATSNVRGSRWPPTTRSPAAAF